ncbi:MAG TPA: hypothetical protein VFL83_22235 [Anaeromyxobacter sp.]|nr:hypothetical protein [Anaeromyxobacter sp.]
MRIALALAAAAALPLAARAEGGAVDWQRKVVTCTGSGAANLRDAAGNPAVARIGAEKAARLDALRSCMETLKGVQLQSGQTVGGALASDAALSGKVEGLVRGFKVVGKPRYFSDGGVELDVEVPLEGGLSDALLPRPDAAGPTALVVDARGQKVVAALAPRILDEAGRELYGPASLGEAGRRAGAAAYARDLDAARATLKERLGDRPLVVKAIRAQGADLVVSAADAASLSGKNLAFLAEGRVVILAD